ncbi:glycosyltransferase [Synechococcus sp. A10-1-5-1]|uniref:glycosyltransferase family 4 protein n=1 Tax=Synechococcus sp. A10-1-5-1 TaxID=2936507 RepID=UPI0020010ED1|nr:glycosyltransferase [Synechococcus sp. A10-1-5-1]UPM49244.1 glycosyltransferase [Synechococcus sp. A10-1-5-1]
MRSLRFLVPGTTGRFRCGGLLVELQTARMLSGLGPVEVVTYRQREQGRPFLADLLRDEPLPGGAGTALWIVSWGFDVPWLLRQLKGRACAYHAHSSGYGFSLPAGVPVLAVSRNTLGYWGDQAPRNPLWLVPNALGSEWLERGQRSGAGERSIDVLVQLRKNSAYVLRQLVPALQAKGLRVEVQSGWVDDLVDLFNSAKVVLYDSADYWRGRGVTEGFGLPPLEALACGCVVFSSFNHALADTLDPGRMGHQLGSGTLAADLEAISAAVSDPASWRPDQSDLTALLATANEAELLTRWRQALEAVTQHWDRIFAGEPALKAPARWTLRLQAKLRPIGSLAGRLRP